MIGPQGSGGGGGSGIWELIETQTVPADTDTVDFLGLNGEFDGLLSRLHDHQGRRWKRECSASAQCDHH
jgi:hypothetical protein